MPFLLVMGIAVVSGGIALFVLLYESGVEGFGNFGEAMFTVVLSLVLVAFEGETFLASVLAAVLVLLLASFVAVILLNLLICEFSLPRTHTSFFPLLFSWFC